MFAQMSVNLDEELQVDENSLEYGLVRNCTSAEVLKLFGISDVFRNRLCSVIQKLTVIPDKIYSTLAEGVELLPYFESLQEIDFTKADSTSRTEFLDGVRRMRAVNSLIMDYEQCTSSDMIELISPLDEDSVKRFYKKLTVISHKPQIENKTSQSKILILISFCPKLSYLTTEQVQFVEDQTDFDQYFYSKKSNLKYLVTQILEPISGPTTLSTNYFSGLNYLYLQINSDQNLMTLKHDNIHTLKVESLGGALKSFDINCPRLTRLVLIHNGDNSVMVSSNQLVQIFTVSQNLEKCVVCTADLLDVSSFEKNPNLIELQINSISINAIYQQRGVMAKQICQIAEQFSNLRILKLFNVCSQIKDYHIIRLVMQHPNVEEVFLS